MTRARTLRGAAAFLAACLIGCSGPSENIVAPPPLPGLLGLTPAQSYIEVAQQVSLRVDAVSDHGDPIGNTGLLEFSSSNPSKVSIDPRSGIATGVDTGSATITVQSLSKPLRFATAVITVVAPHVLDMFATDSLTFAPQALLVKANQDGSGQFTLHFGHVAHHVRVIIHNVYGAAPIDLGVQSDTSIVIPINRRRNTYELHCLIHPSMAATVVIK